MENISSVEWSFKEFEELLRRNNTKNTPTSKRLAILPKFVPQEAAKHIFLTYGVNQISVAVFVTFTDKVIYISTMSKSLKPEAAYPQLCNQFNKINSNWENFSILLVPSNAKLGAEPNKAIESSENCNILLIQRIIYYPYFNIKDRLAKETWAMVLNGIDVFIRNYTFFKEAKESLYLLKFGDVKSIDARKAHLLIKEGIKSLGFQSIKDSSENGKLILLIAVNDTGDSCEKWGTFPVVFETKNGTIESRLVFAIDAKVVNFEENRHYAPLMEFISLVNCELKCGQFFIDFKRSQVGIKHSFCYVGYEDKDIQSIPQEMISNTISAYKTYGRGLHKIYHEGKRLNIDELFAFCKKRHHKSYERFQIDGDTEDERERKNVKYFELVKAFDRQEDYKKEKRIFSAIVKRKFLKEMIEGDKAYFDNESRTVRYQFVDPTPLSDALRKKGNANLEGAFETLFKELYLAKLTFIGEPYKYLGTFLRELKIKSDKPLQELFETISYDIDLIQYLGKWLENFLKYLNSELEENPSRYITDIDYIHAVCGIPTINSIEEENIKILESPIFTVELRDINDKKENIKLYHKYMATHHDNINICYGIFKFRKKNYILVEYHPFYLAKIWVKASFELREIYDIVEVLTKVRAYCFSKKQDLQAITPYLVKVNKKTHKLVLDYCLPEDIPISWKAPEDIKNLDTAKRFSFNLSIFIYYLLTGKNYFEELAKIKKEELLNKKLDDYLDSTIVSQEMRQKFKDSRNCSFIQKMILGRNTFWLNKKFEEKNPEFVEIMTEGFKLESYQRPSHNWYLSRIKEIRAAIRTDEEAKLNSNPSLHLKSVFEKLLQEY